MDVGLNSQLLDQAYQQMVLTNNELNAEMTKLATGQRITEAADDSVDFVLGMFFNGDVAALEAAERNAMDAQSMLDTANGVVEGAADLMIRAEELAIRANSSALSDDERAYIDAEVQSIKTELNDLSSSTTFNGVPVFDSTLSFQVGIEAGDQITVETGDLSTANLGIDGVQADTQANAQAALPAIQAGLDQLLAETASIRNASSALSNRSSFLGQNIIDVSAAGSRIQDADLGKVMTDLSSLFARQDAGAIILSHAQDSLRTVLGAVI